MLDELGYNTGGADGIYGKNTSAAVKKFQEDNSLQADGIIGNQTLTYLKTMNAVKDAPDYAKNSAMESASKAKEGGITDDTILMSTKTFEKAIENISGVRKTTGGGSVQTSVQNNQVVITGVTIPASDGKKEQIPTDKPSIAATATEDVARFAKKVSTKREEVQTSATVNVNASQQIGCLAPDQGKANTPKSLKELEALKWSQVKDINSFIDAKWTSIQASLQSSTSELKELAGVGDSELTGNYAIDVFQLMEDYGNATWASDPLQGPASYSYADNLLAGLFSGIGKGGKYIAKALTKADDVAEITSKTADDIVDSISKVKKPINRPSWKKVQIDMEEVITGHTSSGSRAKQSGIKDLFPEDMSEEIIEKEVRTAYKNSQQVGSPQFDGQQTRIKLQGKGNRGVVEMWYNTDAKIIETAYPISGKKVKIP